MFVVKFCCAAKLLEGCENFCFCSSSQVNQTRGVYVFDDASDCRINLEKETIKNINKKWKDLIGRECAQARVDVLFVDVVFTPGAL